METTLVNMKDGWPKDGSLAFMENGRFLAEIIYSYGAIFGVIEYKNGIPTLYYDKLRADWAAGMIHRRRKAGTLAQYGMQYLTGRETSENEVLAMARRWFLAYASACVDEAIVNAG